MNKKEFNQLSSQLSILEDRKPVEDIVAALNMMIPDIVAHESAMKVGELMKIPQYKW